MYSIREEHHNPVLRVRAHEIPPAEIQSDATRTLIQEMKDLLAKEDYGVALAAPQVGASVRLFIVAKKALSKRALATAQRGLDPEAPETDTALIDEVYINPVILKMSRAKKDKHEGCLSIRGKWGMVPRAEKVAIQAMNERGEICTRGASGFLAHIFQHEMDHLDGILYTDKATEVFDDTKDNE